MGTPAWVLVPPLSQNEMFEVLRNAITFVAALGVGVTLFLSYRKQRATERQLVLTQEANENAAEMLKVASASLQATLEQHSVDYEDRLRSRYSTAAQQIGDANASLAAAGVIAMAAVADEWHKLGRKRDRDDCIRMLIAALPADTRSAEDVDVLRSTLQSTFRGRMGASAPAEIAWWRAPMDFTATRAKFGRVDGWVLEQGRVRIKCSQLATSNETRVIQRATVDGGLLDVSVDEGESYLLLVNVALQEGGIDISFDGSVAETTKTVFRNSTFFKGRLKFEEPNFPPMNRTLVFERCHFESPSIILPNESQYDVTFESCVFASIPFIPSRGKVGEAATVNFTGRNVFTGGMPDFSAAPPRNAQVVAASVMPSRTGN
ncbi:hypothetical protein [Paenarthrobacter sp. YIM B13468]|uniref:hypothetical protein n=1 Tax=Paenarthrobacter sp. YIM B13468 TaxID=3366295 RepID=UPI00366D6DFD